MFNTSSRPVESPISGTSMILGIAVIATVSVLLLSWALRDRTPTGNEVRIGELNGQVDRERLEFEPRSDESVSADLDSLKIVSNISAPAQPTNLYQPFFGAPSDGYKPNRETAVAIAGQEALLLHPTKSVVTSAERTASAASLNKQTEK